MVQLAVVFGGIQLSGLVHGVSDLFLLWRFTRSHTKFYECEET